MRLSLRNAAVADHGHAHIIRLKLRDMSQLFNSMDPSPFVEKDLDDDAEGFILSWPRNFLQTLRSNCAFTWNNGPLMTPKNPLRKLSTITSHTAPRLLTWSSNAF